MIDYSVILSDNQICGFRIARDQSSNGTFKDEGFGLLFFIRYQTSGQD